MVLPVEAIKELLHPYACRKRSIAKTERTEPRGSQTSPVIKRIALNWDPFRRVQMTFAMLFPTPLTSDPFTAEKAQLCKSATRPKPLLVATVDMSPSMWSWFAGSGPRVSFEFGNSLQEEGGGWIYLSILRFRSRCTGALFWLQAWTTSYFRLLLIEFDHIAKNRTAFWAADGSDGEEIIR